MAKTPNTGKEHRKNVKHSEVYPEHQLVLQLELEK